MASSFRAAAPQDRHGPGPEDALPVPDPPLPPDALDEPEGEPDPLERVMNEDPALAELLRLPPSDPRSAAAWREAYCSLARRDERRYREGLPGPPSAADGGSLGRVLEMAAKAERSQPLHESADLPDDDRNGYAAAGSALRDGHRNGQGAEAARGEKVTAFVDARTGRRERRSVEEGRRPARGRTRSAQELARAADPAFKAAEAERKRKKRAEAKARKQGEVA